MHRPPLPDTTSATPRVASQLLDRRTFLSGCGSAIAMAVLASAAPRPLMAASDG